MAIRAADLVLRKTCIPRQSCIPHLLTSLASKRSLSNAWSPMPQASRPSRGPSLTPVSTTSPRRPSRPPIELRAEEEQVAHAASASRRFNKMFWVTSIFGFSLALYLSMIAVGYHKAWQMSKTLGLTAEDDVADRYNDAKRDYDDEVDQAERFMFMGAKRRRLVSQAKGNVLEVSVGTGRNMQYYNLKPGNVADTMSSRKEEYVTSITFNDQARVMVNAAKERFGKQELAKTPAKCFAGPVVFVEGDGGKPGVIRKPEGGFDTIVQTMGLCSMTDPVGFLRTIGELCKKPAGPGVLGGRILLLEHGQGYYGWLNYFLDRLAPWHADRYGCWWNKDIGAMVEETGLSVESIKRYHLGTTWEIVLRPKSNNAEKTQTVKKQD